MSQQPLEPPSPKSPASPASPKPLEYPDSPTSSWFERNASAISAEEPSYVKSDLLDRRPPSPYMDFDRQERLQGGARTVMPLRRPPLKEQGLETLADAVRVKVTYVIYESRVSHEAMKTSATKIREILVRNKTRDNSLGNFRTAKLQSMHHSMLFKLIILQGFVDEQALKDIQGLEWVQIVTDTSPWPHEVKNLWSKTPSDQHNRHDK